MLGGTRSPSLCSSQFDPHRALRSADAGADHLALLAVDLAVAQVADPPGAELSDAGVADALAASERQLEPGLLPGDEDGLRPVGFGLGLARDERDAAALALPPLAELGLEALHVEVLQLALSLPMVGQGVEHLPRPGGERLALAPVRTQLFEVGGLDAALGTGELDVHPEAGTPPVEVVESIAEDHVVLGAIRMHLDDVRQLIAAIKGAEHAHDRCDAAARADEQELLRRRVRQHEVALDSPETDHLARLRLADEVRRHLAALDQLRGDRDAAIGP